jgi:type II secretory ATPase GspE/PulE/Tfp pilus assembly ATPase PilB-like protein
LGCFFLLRSFILFSPIGRIQTFLRAGIYQRHTAGTGLPVDFTLYTHNEVNAGITLYKPVGCSECSNGYKGRVGIYEMMQMSESIANLIMEGGNSLQIAQMAINEGMMTLYRSGLEKARIGLTSLAEVNRVTCI